MRDLTKSQILNYLQQNYSASVKELSAALSLTKANIQYHLQEMVKSGEIVRSYPAQHKVPKGRPEYIYQLISTNTEDNYQGLVDALLQMTFCNNREKDKETMDALTRLVFLHYQKKPNLIINLNQMIKELNIRNYDSHWEARKNGPTVFLKKCPYSALLPSHPELCWMDRTFISHLLDADINHIAKFNKDFPDRICIFEVLAN